MINKESGVLGVSGVSNDMRDIEDGIARGDERSKLVMDMYEYRILKIYRSLYGRSRRRRRDSVHRRCGREPDRRPQKRVRPPRLHGRGT